MAVDVVVVGAGLSGLVCAERLSRAGTSVTVLEARDRVGGRTFSQPLGGATFDFGGQWIGPKQPRVQALARDLALETFPTWAHGRHVLAVGGHVSTYTGTIPRLSLVGLAGLGVAIARIEVLTRRVSRQEPWAAKGARGLDAKRADSLLAGVSDARAHAAFDAAVRTVFGAEPRDVSLLAFLWYMRAGGGFFHLVDVHGGAQERRFVNGAQGLSLALTRRIGTMHVKLGAPVRAIRQTGTGVEVVADGETHAAKYAVVAMPPALAAEITYEPALPEARAEIARRVKMGATVKVLAVYERAFWRSAGLSGQAVFGEPPLSVAFDNTTRDGAHAALVGFVVGEPARGWAERSSDSRRVAVLEQLAQAFGDEARRPAHYHEQDWSTERFTRGCPVALPEPGALSQLGPALRAPCGRVHWAGTETATESPGYLEGAIEAGERAASEIRARL